MIAAGEILMAVEERDRPRLLSEPEKQFDCRPFDATAALSATAIADRITTDRVRADYRGQQQVMRSDLLFLAIADAADAIAFFTHDVRCRRLATHVGIAARGLPYPEHEDE